MKQSKQRGSAQATKLKKEKSRPEGNRFEKTKKIRVKWDGFKGKVISD